MEFLEGKAIARILLEKYSNNPRGWSFTVAPARKYGFFDAIVSSSNEAWQIKIDSIFKPFPMMLGVATEVDLGRMNSYGPIPFGYRKIEPGLALELMNEAEDEEGGGGGADPGMNLGTMLRSLEPVVPQSGGSYAEGPFVLTNRNLVRYSENQKTLDDRLSSELHKIINARYPSYG